MATIEERRAIAQAYIRQIQDILKRAAEDGYSLDIDIGYDASGAPEEFDVCLMDPTIKNGYLAGVVATISWE